MAEDWRLTRTVALIGLMGAGKTAVGRALSARLNVPFDDSDDAIEAAAAMTIPEIFENYGEAFFRRREGEVIARLLQGSPCVLSTGGGAWLTEETRARIQSGGTALWLDAPVELLWQRVRHRDSRPLLRTADPRGTLERLHAQRAPVYALADLHLDVRAEDDIAATAERVIGLLKQEAGVLEAA